MHSSSDVITLERVLEKAWEDGSPVAGQTTEERREVAAVALRRIRSFERRGVPANDRSRQISDLARGLIARFEHEPSSVGPLLVDYKFVAEVLLDSITLGPYEL